jgi:hypothetical protein
MKLTDEGRTTLSSPEDRNAPSSIRSNFESLSNLTHFSDLQNAKHFSQRILTDAGIIIEVKSLPENAFDSICCNCEQNSKVSNRKCWKFGENRESIV